MNYRMIKYTLGWLMVFEAGFLLVPIITAICYREWSTLLAFIGVAAICAALGLICVIKKPQNTSIFAREGFVIALITEASIRSRFFTDELAYAVKNKVPILPVVAGNSYVLFELMKTVPEIGRYQLENLSADPTDEEIERVVKDAVEIQKRFFH